MNNLIKQDKSSLKDIKYIVAVAAGKGGVGKSITTVNLALALAKEGLKVGILDADVYGPSLRKMLKEDKPPYKEEFTDRIEPGLACGIHVMSMAYFREDNKASVLRAPIANGLVLQFIYDVNWGELDFLLIDFPPGTGDIQLTLMQQAFIDGAIIITTPQEVALIDVSKAMQMFERLDIPLLGVIENMSYFMESNKKHYIFGRDGGKKLAEEFGVELLGEVPLDPQISFCADNGLSIFDYVKDNPTIEIFSFLSKTLLEKLDALKNIACNGLKSFEVIWDSSLVVEGLEEVGVNIIKEKFVLVRKIFQKDAASFRIEWTDGGNSDFNLHELQKRCPCRRCADENLRKNISLSMKDVQALRIYNVGRYALCIEFTSGCSSGIYTYAFLRQNPKEAIL